MRALLLLLVVGQARSYYEQEGNYYEFENEDPTTKFTTLAEHGYLTRHRRRDPENSARTLSPEEAAGVKGALKKILPQHDLEELFSSSLPTGADTSTTWYTVKDILSDILGNLNLKDDATDNEETGTPERTVAPEHWKPVYELSNDSTTEIVLGKSNEANQTTPRNNSKEVENVPQLGVKIGVNRSTEADIVYLEDDKTDAKESTKAEIVYEEDEKTDAKANTKISLKPDAKTKAKADVRIDAKTGANESAEVEIIYQEDDKTDAKENTKAEIVYEEDEKTDAKENKKIDLKLDAKTEAKTEAKTDVKIDAKTNAKTVKTDAKTGAKDSTEAEIINQEDDNADAKESSKEEIVYEEDAKEDTEQNTTDKIYVQLADRETRTPNTNVLKSQNKYYEDSNLLDYIDRAAEDKLILREDETTDAGTKTTSSTTTTTKKSTTPRKTNKRKRTSSTARTFSRTRKRKTRTSPKPTAKLDIPKLLAILSNLTQDYSNNLMAALNKSLQSFTIPTCPTFTTTTEPPTTTVTTTTNAYANLTGTIMGKCFVCGLEDAMMPRNAHCADAFQTDFIPLVPVNPQSRGEIARFRKYCRWMNIPKYFINASETRSMWGRWTGGCSVRWIDVSGIYTQRTCRNRHRAVMGRHWGSKRMAKLEMALQHVDNGCVQSPMSSLVPLSRGVSLYARFHACVCTGNWCNRALSTCQWTLFSIISPLLLTFLLNT